MYLAAIFVNFSECFGQMEFICFKYNNHTIWPQHHPEIFFSWKKKQSRTRPTDLNLTSLLANLWIYLQKMSIKRAQHSCLSYPLCTISTKHLHLVNHVCPLIKLLWQITYLFSSFKSLKTVNCHRNWIQGSASVFTSYNYNNCLVHGSLLHIQAYIKIILFS